MVMRVAATNRRKRCTGCGLRKLGCEFGGDSRHSDGLKSTCRGCEASTRRRRLRERPKRERAVRRAWERANAGKRNAQARERIAGSPGLTSWRGMIARCSVATLPEYPRYGGRGIAVCDRWQGEAGFENFISDMGPRPSPQHSIDRIDNDGDYEPENCRWATQSTQMRNTRRSRVVTVNGISRTAVEWDERMGFRAGTITGRLHRGWSEREALLVPPGMRRSAWRSSREGAR